MRKLKLQVQLSIDGFIAGPSGEMDWVTHEWDDELKNYVIALTEPVGTIVLGRKLAEGFIPYWAAHPEQEGAEKFNTTPRVVFTHTLQSSPWENATLATGDLIREINSLKSQEGGDIIAYGGGTFVSALIQHELIDEIHLFINPAVLGSGMPIFARSSPPQKLHLKHAQSFACGIAVLCYTTSV